LSAVASKIDLTRAGLRPPPPGAASISATRPVTCGVACEVPAKSATHALPGGFVLQKFWLGSAIVVE
jgi:hypothetical protein